MSIRLFCDLNQEWSHTARSRSAKRSLAGWRKEEEVLADLDSLDAIVEVAHGEHRDRRDEVMAALLRLGEDDVLARRVVLHVVMPGLLRQTKRFVPGPHTEEEVAATIVAVAWRRICTYRLDRRPRNIGGNIAMDARQRAADALFRHKEVEVRTAELAALRASPVARRDPAVHLVGVLDQAVKKKVVSADDARLVALTRITDVPVAELAAERGVLPHSLRRRRLRVEAALSAAVA